MSGGCSRSAWSASLRAARWKPPSALGRGDEAAAALPRSNSCPEPAFLRFPGA